MNGSFNIRDATADSTKAFYRSWIIFSLPLVASGLVTHALIGISESFHARLFQAVSMLGAFIFGLLCWFGTETIVSALYFQMMSDGPGPSWRNSIQVLKSSGFWPFAAKTTVFTIGWAIPAYIVGVVIKSVLKAVFIHSPWASFALRAGAFLRGGGTHALTLIWVTILTVMLTRYWFVFPLFAFQKGGTRESFRKAVTLAVDSWRSMWVLALIFAVFMFVPDDFVKGWIGHNAVPRYFATAWTYLNMLYVAIFSAWALILRCNLLLQIIDHQV